MSEARPTPDALRLEGVSKTYNAGRPNEVRVLSDVSLDVAPGEVVALVAPSGAGKSTLLHIAGLLDTPDEGTVALGGQPMGALGDRRRTEARRSTVGFVYQFHHLLPEFSAAENVVLPQLANGVGAARGRGPRPRPPRPRGGAGRAPTTAPPPSRAASSSASPSAGRWPTRPRLLLADEPTGNLDPATSTLVFGALMDLVRGTGLAALIATHNLDLAARMDRRLRLEGGRVVPA